VYPFLRAFWNLAAVGGAIAVGFTTQNAGFVAITLIGGFIVPRMLGLAGPVGPFARYRYAARQGGAGAGSPWGGGWWGGPGGGRRWAGPCAGGAVPRGFEEWHRQSHQAQPTSPPPSTV